jgi:hypothetical protein
MKTSRCLLCALAGFVTPLLAQNPVGIDPGAQIVVGATEAAAPVLNAEQLDQLLGPIALYPDALIALILPAATAPTDIVLAARYLRENANDLSQVENRGWDDSVKSLTHYPDVVKWMDENLNWTKQLGDAFATQPTEVMKSIQRLRDRARTTGALVDTPQQQVLVESQAIRIVPAQPDVIYVPTYDPAIVYVDRPLYYSYGRPLLSFGLGWRVGSWLAYDFDWHRCTLWVGDRHRPWHGRHDWHRPIITPTIVTHHTTYPNYRHPRQWTPPSRWTRPTYTSSHSDRSYTGNRSTHSGGHATYSGSPSKYPGTPAGSSSTRIVSPSSSYQGNRSHDSNRLNTASALPVAPPLRVANTSAPHAPMGPHVSSPVATTAPSYRGRGNDNDGARSRDSHSRTYTPPASTPLPVAPAMRVHGAGSHSYATVTAPAAAPARTYTPRASTPVAAPPLHVQNASPRSVPAGPVAAPAAVHSAPPASSRQSAPATTPSSPERGDYGGRVGRDRRSID